MPFYKNVRTLIYPNLVLNSISRPKGKKTLYFTGVVRGADTELSKQRKLLVLGTVGPGYGWELRDSLFLFFT